MNLGHVLPILKTGNEPLSINGNNLKITLLDFWKWSVSDILSNATRGRLAEFIVATATNIDITIVKDEWGAYDLSTPDGIKIEVKSAAYLQTWYQRVLSKISFSIKLARHWDPESNISSSEPKRHADVYVFCLLKHEDKQTINPLNLNHWDFYVLGTFELTNYPRSQHSITLKSLQKLTFAIGYNDLENSIKEKYRMQNEHVIYS